MVKTRRAGGAAPLYLFCLTAPYSCHWPCRCRVCTSGCRVQHPTSSLTSLKMVVAFTKLSNLALSGVPCCSTCVPTLTDKIASAPSTVIKMSFHGQLTLSRTGTALKEQHPPTVFCQATASYQASYNNLPSNSILPINQQHSANQQYPTN